MDCGRISDPSKRTDVSPASSIERLQMEVMAEVRLQLQDTGHERVHLRRLGNLEEFYEAGLAGCGAPWHQDGETIHRSVDTPIFPTTC